MKEKFKDFYKKNLVAIVMSFSVLLVIALVTLVVQVNKAKAEVENAKIVLQGMKEENIELEQKLLALFDDKQEFLAKDVTKEQVDMEISTPLLPDVPTGEMYEERKVALADREKINELIAKAQFYFEYQDKTNALFTKQVLNGAEVARDIVIKKDLKKEDLLFVEDLYENTLFTQKVRGIVTEADIQLKELEIAYKEVEESERDKENRDKNDNALIAVEKVKNPELKKELLDRLNPIKAEIDKKEAEEKARADEYNRLLNEQTQRNRERAIRGEFSEIEIDPIVVPDDWTSENTSNQVATPPVNEGQAAPPAVVTPPPAPTLPPVQEFRCMGWVKNPAGVIIASKIFNSYDEAEAWASNELWNYIWEEDGDKYSFGISPA